MGDGNVAFRLASNLKTAWLSSTARGITPAGTVFRVTEEHKPPHHDKGSNNREGFFLATATLLYKRWKSDVLPAWSEIHANYKKKQFWCLAKLF